MQHLDEGAIHTWLDGALSPDEARRVEEHAASCEACSALVAEARGLVAAASRILTALDDVPERVIPARAGGSPVPDQLAELRARKAAEQVAEKRRRWLRPRFAATAAVVLVAVGTLAVLQRSTLPVVAPVDEARIGNRVPVPAAAPEVARPVLRDTASVVEEKSDALRATPAVPKNALELDRQERALPAVPGAAASRELRAAGLRKEAKVEDRRVVADSIGAPADSKTLRQNVAGVAVAGARRDQAQLQTPQQASQLGAVQQPKQLQAAADFAGRQAPRDSVAAKPAPPSSLLERARSRDSVRLAEVVVTGVGARGERPSEPSAALFAGCYQIQSREGMAGAAGLLPQRIALDTAVASPGADTVRYRARSLDIGGSPAAQLSWRPVSPGLVEIAVRRDSTVADARIALADAVVPSFAAKAQADRAAGGPPGERVGGYTAGRISCPR